MSSVLANSPRTVCPVLILLPNKKLATLYFKDIVDGKLENDLGRESFNRTITKINLHHFDRLISGKLNHNHKNVFLGSFDGNGIDSQANMRGVTVQEYLKETKF